MATPELWLKPAQIETVSRRHEPRHKTDSLTRDNREKTRPAQARLKRSTPWDARAVPKRRLRREKHRRSLSENGCDALSVSFRLHVNEREN